MQPHEVLVPVFAIFAIFIALPWIVLSFLARRREQVNRTSLDPSMNHKLMTIADRLEQRLDAIEDLLDHETPGWRKPGDRRVA